MESKDQQVQDDHEVSDYEIDFENCWLGIVGELFKLRLLGYEYGLQSGLQVEGLPLCVN